MLHSKRHPSSKTMFTGTSAPTQASHKRRRLISPPPHLSNDDGPLNLSTPTRLSVLTQGSPTGESEGKLAATGGPKNPILTNAYCTSCRRILHATRTGIVECARCNAILCAICSRRCTQNIPSYPPTPQLSFTPTPTPSPSFPIRRLALHAANDTNSLSVNLTAKSDDASKKRKNATNDRPHDNASCAAKFFVRIPFQESSLLTFADGNVKVDADGGGCGRVVCKGCCYEDGDAVTCFSCNGTR
ncbi:hypothetical protein PLEOSDRAFT_158880 [Pleurotus ostreatus PC15]|uniref:Uncharacterized protein n=1 Tax=Pleurotus ostreatus (strain PC15) TaxID=1137138 RepID=A0A067NGR2_PLEO1|nr:hypothetical protein PLEOSDRAFT_158880 [Pleurotus ostreatus PC15]